MPTTVLQTRKGAAQYRRILSEGLGITVEDVYYHRNGVSGAGFHVVKFRVTGKGSRGIPPLVAVLFDGEDDTDIINTHIAVLNQDLDLRVRWRGADAYGKDLLKVVARWETKGRPVLVAGQALLAQGAVELRAAEEALRTPTRKER